MIVRDLVTAALSRLGVLAPDISLTADEEALALQALNDLLESWALDPLRLYRVVREYATADGGTGPLLIARPIRIVYLTVQIAPGRDREVRQIGFDQYAAISRKGLVNAYPEVVYVDDNYPYAELSLYPNPVAGQVFTLWSERPLARFQSLDDPVNLPPGYARALKFHLAVELAPDYQVAVAPALAALAADALKALKRRNVRVPGLELDALGAGRGGYNVIADA